MRGLITGVAGFIGSHLAERLLADGHAVIGVDCFTPYYDVELKRSNLSAIVEHDAFTLVERDLNAIDLHGLLDGVDVVWHQAGQPGVRASWDQFDSYVMHNITATQHLLAAALDAGVDRLVYASSSSVYGEATSYPTTEDLLPRPKSPYGVTKLGAEHLCNVYARNYGLPTVALRYFTVFGPRQRPDMAMHRLAEAALHGGTFPLFGDGTQVRDFTYVDDIVEANVLAGLDGGAPPGTVVNLSGGGSCDLNWVISTVEELAGRPIELERRGFQAGDVDRTGGSTELARDVLGWEPRVDVAEGLARQVAWHRGRG